MDYFVIEYKHIVKCCIFHENQHSRTKQEL